MLVLELFALIALVVLVLVVSVLVVLVWFGLLLWSLQLHLESLHTDLEAVHGLDGILCTLVIVETDETWKPNSRHTIVTQGTQQK